MLITEDEGAPPESHQTPESTGLHPGACSSQNRTCWGLVSSLRPHSGRRGSSEECGIGSKSGSCLGSGCQPGAEGRAPLHDFPPCLLLAFLFISLYVTTTNPPPTSPPLPLSLCLPPSLLLSLSVFSTWSISLFKCISSPFLPCPLPSAEWLCEHVSSGLSIPSCSCSLSSCPPCLSFLIQVRNDPQASFTKQRSQRVFLMLKTIQDPTPLGAPSPQ